MRAGKLGTWHFVRPDKRIAFATLVFCALTIVAGRWQDGRAAYKAELQTRFDQRSELPPARLGESIADGRDYDQRPVVAVGRYDATHLVLVDNKVHEGRAGYQVYMPLKIEGAENYVLVNRGWTPQGRTRADLPRVATPSAPVEVRGVATMPGGQYLELKAQSPAGPLWQNLDFERFRAHSKLPLLPVIIEQTGEAGDGLVRAYRRPDFGIDKHRIYALQWYSFCVLAIVLYAFFHIKRIPRTS